MHIIIIDCIVQSGTAPPNGTAIPAASRRGNPPCTSQPPSSTRRIGPILTSIAAARVDVTFAPVERDHIQPEPEQPRTQNSGPRCPGRPAITAEQPHHAEGERGREQAAQRERTRREMPARPRYGSRRRPKPIARLPLPLRQGPQHRAARSTVTFCSWHPVITMECVDRFVDRAICANSAIRAIRGTARWYPCR